MSFVRTITFFIFGGLFGGKSCICYPPSRPLSRRCPTTPSSPFTSISRRRTMPRPFSPSFYPSVGIPMRFGAAEGDENLPSPGRRGNIGEGPCTFVGALRTSLWVQTSRGGHRFAIFLGNSSSTTDANLRPCHAHTHASWGGRRFGPGASGFENTAASQLTSRSWHGVARSSPWRWGRPCCWWPPRCSPSAGVALPAEGCAERPSRRADGRVWWPRVVTIVRAEDRLGTGCIRCGTVGVGRVLHFWNQNQSDQERTVSRAVVYWAAISETKRKTN